MMLLLITVIVTLSFFAATRTITASQLQEGGDIAFFKSVLSPVVNPERDVTFRLFTPPYKTEPLKLTIGQNVERWKPPGTNDSTKIIIHGWTDSGDSPWVQTMRTKYLARSDCSVIVIDWSPISTKEYVIAVSLVVQVGERLAKLLRYLESEVQLSLSNVHILGHSLGAHVAGIAGCKLSGKIGRITGMDPARPGFEVPKLKDPQEHLDPTDAIFVDVIHTSAGTAGFIRPIGHADFYPNGGTFRQPGCPPLMAQYCSHGRSYEYLTESISKPRAFPAKQCDSWLTYKSGKCGKTARVYMGNDLNPDARGIYFLETNSESPFGKGT